MPKTNKMPLERVKFRNIH